MKSVLCIVCVVWIFGLASLKGQDPGIRLKAARDTFLKGKPLVALSMTDSLLVSDTIGYEIRMLRGEIFESQGNLGGALNEYNLLLVSRPDDAVLLSRMGKASYYNGDRIPALGLLNRATLSDPTRLEAYQTKIRILMDLGRTQEALAASDSTLWMGEDPVSYFLQGQVNEMLGEPQKAEWAYVKAIRLKPDYQEAYKALIMLQISMGKTEDALYYADRMIGLRVGDRDLLLFRLNVLMSANRTDDAIAAISKMIEATPSDSALLLTRGRYYLQGRKFDEALADFSKVLPYSPVEVNFWKGMAFKEKELLDSARKSFEEVRFRVKPGTVDTLWMQKARSELFVLDREQDPPTLRFPDFEANDLAELSIPEAVDTLLLRMSVVDRSEIQSVRMNDSSVYFNPNRRMVLVLLKVPVAGREGVKIDAADVYGNAVSTYLRFLFPGSAPADSIAQPLPVEPLPESALSGGLEP
ncbi:MAG: tetratricopeptide repeat protein [Bacteroidales bacterium]